MAVAATAGSGLHPNLRDMLEQVAEAIGLGVGHTRLELEFRDGRLTWYTPAHVRVPASRLDELSRGVGAGGVGG
jgi:hypothetical protein